MRVEQIEVMQQKCSKHLHEGQVAINAAQLKLSSTCPQSSAPFRQ